MAANKKPAKMANRNVGLETVKDDGDKYTVVLGDGRRAYAGAGVALPEAVRLAITLVAPAYVAKVEADGSLTLGSVTNGAFVATATAASEALAA
jgi:hypothetical protein